MKIATAEPRRVLVTGIAAGLGRRLCEEFLAAGCEVFGCDVDADALAQLSADANSNRLSLIRCDLTDSEQVEQMLHEVLQKSDYIDVLINNAGIAGPRAAIDEITDPDWVASIEANLYAPIRCIRALTPAMKRRRRGVILNISTSSVRTLPMNRSPYVVTKSALEALTMTLARELGQFGIRCNAIRPGLMDNERGRNSISRVAAQSNRLYQDVLADELKFVFLGSIVTMDEVAAAVLYLASEQGRNITGQALSVDGGQLWEA